MAENTIIHEISLAGYKATSTGGMLDLGTWGSYGIEKLHLTLDAAWQDLTITAFFNVNGEVVAKRVVGKDGYADVPWEATKKNTFAGCLAFEGSINGQRRISTNLNYKVTNHSETTDSDPVPTDDRWNQFVTETKEYRDGAFEAAERANARAEDAEAASEGAQAAARAAKASENAAAASASNAAADAAKAGPYAKAAQAAQEAAENAAAAAAASKSAADTLAAEAARAALAAENSKAAANNAAYFAGENATAAQKAAATATAAANDAGQSASDAGQSASDAAASKAAAETAAKAAQDAQTATAAAKAEAVKAQGTAQTAAKSAQDAQAAAEKVRDDAKTAQKGAEAARDVAAKSAEAAAKSEANVKQSADTLAESVENVVANTAAVAELKQQVKNITPDDSAIGDKPWSSKHIIDMLCPPLEESGNPVVCYPVAGYALGVKAKWEPMQEGTGTPYPAGGGKQLLDTNKCVPTVGKPYGMTITLDGDIFKVSGVPNEEVAETDFYSFAVCTCSQEELRGKGYKVTAWAIKGKVNNAWGLRTESENALAIAAELTPGVNNDIQLRLMVSKDTPTAWEPYENIRPIKGRDSVRVERCGENLLDEARFPTIKTANNIRTTSEMTLPAGTYTVCVLSVANGVYASGADVEHTYDSNKHTFTLARQTAIMLDAYWSKGRPENDENIWLVEGNEWRPYTPYIGQTNTLTLPETLYGGEVDAVTGEGINEWKSITLYGTETWYTWGVNKNNTNVTGFYTYDINDYSIDGDDVNKILCSTMQHTNSDVYGGRNMGIGFANTGNSRYLIYSVKTDTLSDATDDEKAIASFKTFLADLYAAGTPVQIAYKLATPTPFTATGAQPITALAGANTVLTNADSATVTGRADPVKRIEDLEAAVASIN